MRPCIPCGLCRRVIDFSLASGFEKRSVMRPVPLREIYRRHDRPNRELRTRPKRAAASFESRKNPVMTTLPKFERAGIRKVYPIVSSALLLGVTERGR